MLLLIKVISCDIVYNFNDIHVILKSLIVALPVVTIAGSVTNAGVGIELVS